MKKVLKWVRGSWLRAAQGAWIVLVLASLVLFITGTIVQLGEGPPGPSEATGAEEFTTGDVEIAREMGLPAGLGWFYLLSAITLITNLAYFAVGGWIFWQRRHDWMALLVSLTLVMLGAGFSGAYDALQRTYPPTRWLAEGVLVRSGQHCTLRTPLLPLSRWSVRAPVDTAPGHAAGCRLSHLPLVSDVHSP